MSEKSSVGLLEEKITQGDSQKELQESSEEISFMMCFSLKFLVAFSGISYRIPKDIVFWIPSESSSEKL